MRNFLRCLFCRVTVEEQVEMDLYEAQITLLDASKQLEYYQSVETAMKIRIARLQSAYQTSELAL